MKKVAKEWEKMIATIRYLRKCEIWEYEINFSNTFQQSAFIRIIIIIFFFQRNLLLESFSVRKLPFRRSRIHSTSESERFSLATVVHNLMFKILNACTGWLIKNFSRLINVSNILIGSSGRPNASVQKIDDSSAILNRQLILVIQSEAEISAESMDISYSYSLSEIVRSTDSKSVQKSIMCVAYVPLRIL